MAPRRRKRVRPHHRISRFIKAHRAEIKRGIRMGLRKTKLLSSGLNMLGSKVPQLLPLTTLAAGVARQKGFGRQRGYGVYLPTQSGKGAARGMRHVLV